jgi:hypothetical protein
MSYKLLLTVFIVHLLFSYTVKLRNVTIKCIWESSNGVVIVISVLRCDFFIALYQHRHLS